MSFAGNPTATSAVMPLTSRFSIKLFAVVSMLCVTSSFVPGLFGVTKTVTRRLRCGQMTLRGCEKAGAQLAHHNLVGVLARIVLPRLHFGDDDVFAARERDAELLALHVDELAHALRAVVGSDVLDEVAQRALADEVRFEERLLAQHDLRLLLHEKAEALHLLRYARYRDGADDLAEKLYRQRVAGVDARHLLRLLAPGDARLVFLHHLDGGLVEGADPLTDVAADDDPVFVRDEHAAADDFAGAFRYPLRHLFKHRKHSRDFIQEHSSIIIIHYIYVLRNNVFCGPKRVKCE